MLLYVFANFGEDLHRGPMLWLLKYFRQKIGKTLAFLTQNKAKFFLKIDLNIGFLKKTPIFSPKIV
jgi:hypothetical protein